MTWRSAARDNARKRGPSAQLDVVRAYRERFDSRDTNAQLVLSDFANFTGFYKVAPPGTTADRLHYEAGMRAAFGRFFYFLNLSEADLQRLEEAAHHEARADEEEGIY